MDGDWYNWMPRFTPPYEEVTPETFSEDLSRLVFGQAAPITPEQKNRPPTAQEINFAEAPPSVRKAWIDTEEDPLYPSAKLNIVSPYGLARMDSKNKRAVNGMASAQKNTMSPTAGVGSVKKYYRISNPPRSIPPNGTAPIGSEVAQMKQRQAGRTQRMHALLGSASDFTFPQGQFVVNVSGDAAFKPTVDITLGSETSGNRDDESDDSNDCTRIYGMAMELNKQKKVGPTAKGYIDASDNSSGGVKLPEVMSFPSPTLSTISNTAVCGWYRNDTGIPASESTVTITPSRNHRVESICSSASTSSDPTVSHLSNVTLAQLQAGSGTTPHGHQRSESQDTVATFRSGASENDEFFYSSPHAKMQYQLAKARASNPKARAQSSNHAAAVKPPTAYMATSSPLTEAGTVTQVLTPPSPQHIVLSPDGLAAVQAQAIQHAHAELTASYQEHVNRINQYYQQLLAERDNQSQYYQQQLGDMHNELGAAKQYFDHHCNELTQHYQSQLVGKDIKINTYKTELQTLKQQRQQKSKAHVFETLEIDDKLNALYKLIDETEIGKAEAKSVSMHAATPANQVAFKEPATNVLPAGRQLTPSTGNSTPTPRHWYQQPAPSTFLGAHPSVQPANYGSHECSPDYASSTSSTSTVVQGGKKGENNCKQLQVVPNPDDDVFGGFRPAQLGPGLTYFFETTGFEQNGLTEAISACFSQVEGAVRVLPMVRMKNVPRSSKALYELIDKCQEHIEHRGEAFSMLGNNDEKYLMITGVVHRVIIDTVFREPIITEFQSPYRVDLTYFWDQEVKSREKDIMDVDNRAEYGRRRAELANLTVQLNGFWKWLHAYTNTVLQKVCREVEAAFPDSHGSTLRANLWGPIHEALCLVARIRCDPRYFEYHFQKVGCVWDNNYMVVRNEGLIGQEMANIRTPFVVRCTVRPLVKIKKLDRDDCHIKTVHKAEVLVAARKKNLRPFRRPGNYSHHK